MFLFIWLFFFYLVDMSMGWLASGSHGKYKSIIRAKLGTNAQQLMAIVEVGIISLVITVVIYVVVS